MAMGVKAVTMARLVTAAGGTDRRTKHGRRRTGRGALVSRAFSTYCRLTPHPSVQPGVVECGRGPVDLAARQAGVA